MKAYDKLVRDRIPEIIAADGGKRAVIRACVDDVEYLARLLDKLREESAELVAASGDREGIAKEIADVLEVLRAIQACAGLDSAEVEAVRERRLKERGGFEKRLILVEADEP